MMAAIYWLVGLFAFLTITVVFAVIVVKLINYCEDALELQEEPKERWIPVGINKETLAIEYVLVSEES